MRKRKKTKYKEKDKDKQKHKKSKKRKHDTPGREVSFLKSSSPVTGSHAHQWHLCKPQALQQRQLSTG